MALKALITIDELNLVEVDSDPSQGAGVISPLSSIAILNDGGVSSGFWLKTGSADTAWTVPSSSALPSKQYYADQFDSPNNANWAVNNLAPASADPVNSAFLVRRFDDTAEEGVGWMLTLPTAVTNITLRVKARANTAPATAKQVILRLYNRQIPDNLAITSWSAALQLTAIDIPANAFFQYDSQTISLATLGLTAGRTVQFELTRHGANASDTLVGDWNLLELQVEFS